VERVLSEPGEHLRHKSSPVEQNKRLETILKRVKSEVAERLIRELGTSLTKVARLFGVSTSAISKILQRITRENRE